MTAGDFAELRDCTGTAVLKLNRVLTRFYDRSLAPVDLRLTQVSMLGALADIGPVTVDALADHLVMSGSTVTRNVGLLVDRGLVVRRTGEDRRQRLLDLTPSGRDLLAETLPYWRQAQQRAERVFSEAGFDIESFREHFEVIARRLV